MFVLVGWGLAESKLTEPMSVVMAHEVASLTVINAGQCGCNLAANAG